MRPAKGSAIVFQTKAEAGALSSAFLRISAPALSTPLNGRSAGEGRYARIASSSGWIPTFDAADVHTSGKTLPAAVALRSPATSSSSFSVPASKNFSISSSSASATISMSASRSASTAAAISAGIAPSVNLPLSSV
jgi:hypothetical protein